MSNEHTPLLEGHCDGYGGDAGPPPHEHPHEYDWSADPHAQFCILVGVPPSLPVDDRDPRFRDLNATVPRKSLYGRATRHLADQRFHYYTTAALSNVLLLSQVILGAALTALGASSSSHVIITLFGAANTIIAGLVAYLKSRGQPMRARMFLDDLERVVGEIENSEIMWLGIAHHANGYDDVSTTDGHMVSVRSEIARLTRLYDRAVRSNRASYPDMYGEPVDGSGSGTRTRPQQGSGAGGLPATSPPSAPVATSPTNPGATAAVAPGTFASGMAVEDVEPATAAPAPILISASPRHEPNNMRRGENEVQSLYSDRDSGMRKSSSARELSARRVDPQDIGGSSAGFVGIEPSIPGSRHGPL